MNGPEEAAQHFALEIVDAAMVIAPRGWRSVRLELERRAADSIRVAELTTHLAGDRPLAKPSLGLEVGAFHGVINEAINDLRATLVTRGIAWTAAAFRIDRRDDGAYVCALLDANDAVAHSIVLEGARADALIFTEPLFDALLAAEPAMAERQAALSERVRGHDDWNYDSAVGTLTLSKGVLPWATLHAEPIGSFAYDSETWLWAWANDALADERRAMTRRLRDAARTERGMSALVRPTLPCTEAFATRIAALAAHRVGAEGIYGAPFGPGVLILAVSPGA
jgi:hypothetical protein